MRRENASGSEMRCVRGSERESKQFLAVAASPSLA
jgi:hypothetical protein